MRDETVMNELPETGSLRLCTDFRDCVENVKKLFYASLFTVTVYSFDLTLLLKRFGSPLKTFGLFERNTHVDQCHKWGDETCAAYMFVWLWIDRRNHL